MANGELLRVTQPIVNRALNITASGKPQESPSTPFQVTDASKVTSLSHQKSMDADTNTLLLDADQPSILSQMLSDPAQTVHFLRTIYLLQEVVGMMPMIDNPVSEEIEELFHELMLNPDDIVGEMINQENSETLFKGELFDNLRNMIEEMAKFDKQNLEEALGTAQNKGLIARLFSGEADAAEAKTVQNLLQHLQDAKQASNISVNPDGQNSNPQSNMGQQETSANGQSTQANGNNETNTQTLLTGENGEATATSEEAAKELLNNLNSMRGEQAITVKNMGITNYEDQIKNDIADLLRNMNALSQRNEILQSIGNNLNYLANALAPHKNLAEQLRNLAAQFKNADENFDFEKTKNLVNQYTTQIERSVLYSDKIEKNVAILKYNFSRYMDTTEGLEKSVENMFKYLMNEEDMKQFKDMVYQEILKMASPEGKESTSRVMTTLCRIIEKQVENSNITNLTGDKVEKIIYSLLSSPTNFTPLLHFIIPVDYMGMKSFAEMWIDPVCENDDEEGKKHKNGNHDLTQVLVAFDVADLGRFETELMINKNKMSAYVYVPQDYYDVFKDMKGDIMKAIADTAYTFDKVEVRPLAAPRSLMEVFKTLPIRRTGINVTV